MPNEHSHMCGSGRQRRMSGKSRENCVYCSAKDRNIEADQQRMAETHIKICYQCRAVWKDSPCAKCGGKISVWSAFAQEHYAEQARQAAESETKQYHLADCFCRTCMVLDDYEAAEYVEKKHPFAGTTMAIHPECLTVNEESNNDEVQF